MIDKSIFREYDIRGLVPNQLNEKIIKQIAHAIAKKCYEEDVDENTLIVIIEDEIPIGDTFPPPAASPPGEGTAFIDEPIVGFFDDFPTTGTVIIKKRFT